jgi:hypothetical protein
MLLLRVRAFLRLSEKIRIDRVLGTGSGSANPTLLATMFNLLIADALLGMKG